MYEKKLFLIAWFEKAFFYTVIAASKSVFFINS